jgi:hypothetical protein
MTNCNTRLGGFGFGRGGPGVGLAGFDEGAGGHGEGERRHGGIFQNFFEVDGFGRGEAAAIDVHVQEIGAQDYDEKPEHDGGEQRGPDAQFPANEYEQTQSDFREGKRVCDKLHSPVGEEFEGLHLEREVGEVGGYGELQEEPGPEGVIGEEGFGVAGVDEDGAEDQAADPHDGAGEV